MVYNYRRLIGKIVEIYGTQGAFAAAYGMSERTLSLKLNNKVRFKQDEIDRACELLGIPLSDVDLYFFTRNVQFV